MADQVVIITGAGNGIGLSIVKQLLTSAKVAHVVAVDLDPVRLEALKASDHLRLSIIKGDVSDQSVNKQAVDAALQAQGRLTTLILNAATFRPIGPLPTISLDQWKRSFDINFFSVIHMLRFAWQHLTENSGTVLVTSTRLSQKPSESWACYSCTKAVLNYLCSCIPLEDSRLRCVAITPGAVDTDMHAQMRNDGNVSGPMQKFLDAIKDEGRLLRPEQPASAFAYLVENGVPDDLNGKTVYWEDVVKGGAA